MKFEITANFTPPAATQIATAGAWNWFTQPQAIFIGSETYAGSCSGVNGNVQVSSEANGTFVLKPTLHVDDHSNPALFRRSSDGKIIAIYMRHNFDNNYYQRISTNADDLTAWDAEVNLGASFTNMSKYTYAQLVEIEDGIFNMLRAVFVGGPAGTYTFGMTKTADGGANWTDLAGDANKGTLVFSEGLNQRQYNKICKGGSNRIDILVNNGHPQEYTGNSTYHCYYDGADNTFKKSDGTALTLPIAPSTDLTGVSRLWNGATIESWVWDIKWDAVDGLSGVFATYTNSLTDHRYQYGHWNGSSWDVNEICDAGGTIYPIGDDTQVAYSGGICIDPDDIFTIYCSRETGAGGSHRNGGYFQLWKGVTADNGATWTMTQLTFDASDKYRPYKPEGGNELVYFSGTYTSYISFSGCAVKKLALA
jgi:hypothetical protein